MERTKRKYKYHVIQFIELPYSDIDDHVCVPHSWVRMRRETDRKVVVSYPVEQPTQTIKRVKKRQKFSNEWLLYMATVKYDTDYYDDAELYITLVATNTRNNYGWRINKQGCSGVTNEGDKLLERKTHSSKNNPLSNPYVKILKMSEESLNIDSESEIEKEPNTPPIPKLKIEKKKLSQESEVEPNKNEEPNHASKYTPPPPAPVCEDYSDKESSTQEIFVDRSNDINCMGQSGGSESSTQNRPSVIQSSPNLGNQRTMTEQNFFNELSGLCKEMHANFSDTCTIFDHLRTSFMHTAETFKQVMEAVNEFCYTQSSPAIESTLNEATDKDKKNTEEIQNRSEERKKYDIDDDVNEASKRKRGRPHTVTGAVNGDWDSQHSTNSASISKQAKAQFKNITDQEPRRDRKGERDKYCINDNEVPKNNRDTARRVIEAVKDYCDLQHKAASASSSEDARVRVQKLTEDKQKDRETYDIVDDDKDIEAPKKKLGRQRTVMATVNDHCDSQYNAAIASTSKGATTKGPQIIEEKQKERETYDIDGDDEHNQAPKKRGRPHTVMGTGNDHCDSRYSVSIASTSKGATTKAQQIIEEKQKERETYDIDDDDKDIEAPKKKRCRPRTAMGTLNDYYASRQNVATASTSKGAITKAQQITEEEQKRDRGDQGQKYYNDDDDKDIEAPEKKRGRQRTVMATVNDHCDSRYNAAIASTSKGATTKAQQIVEEKQKERETYNIDGDDEDNQASKKRGRPHTVMGTVNDHCDSRYNVAIASTSNGATTKAQQITEEEQKRDRGEKGQKYYVHDDDDIEAPKKKRVKPRAFALPQAYDPNDSKWTLKYRKPGPGLVELMPHSGVFINATRFFNCKKLAKDCNTLARMLLMEIFTASALSVCSLTGTRAKACEGADVRPGLDEHARMVLLTFVEEFGHENGWNTSTQAVVISMRNKIQEMRPKLLSYSKVYNLY